MWKIAVAMLLSMVTASNVNLYAKTMIVTGVEMETDTIYLKDFNSFVYKANGAEDWVVGDYASCIMSDNGTELVYDDLVLTAKYENFESMYEIVYIPVYVQGEELTSYEAELVSE